MQAVQDMGWTDICSPELNIGLRTMLFDRLLLLHALCSSTEPQLQAGMSAVLGQQTRLYRDNPWPPCMCRKQREVLGIPGPPGAPPLWRASYLVPLFLQDHDLTGGRLQTGRVYLKRTASESQHPRKHLYLVAAAYGKALCAALRNHACGSVRISPTAGGWLSRGIAVYPACSGERDAGADGGWQIGCCSTPLHGGHSTGSSRLVSLVELLSLLGASTHADLPLLSTTLHCLCSCKDHDALCCHRTGQAI